MYFGGRGRASGSSGDDFPGTIRFMKYLFYLGHPAHFHLFKHVVQALRKDGHQTEILIKKKDILEDLLQRSGWEYRNILNRERGDGKWRIAWSLLVRDREMYRIARKTRPDLMVGTSAEITHVGRMLKIPSIVVNEDDHDVVPLFARMAYPFASTILAPVSCRMGRWAHKTIAYEGYHELAYLHPNHFTPDPRVRAGLVGERARYFILRFAQLNAHHDAGRSGINTEVASRLIALLEPHGQVHITAERPLEPQFEPYRIRIDPLEIHSALHYADLYIGDSQTMAAEAAILGTPSLRYNDFVGEIGYLEELEHTYGLTCGVRTRETTRLFEVVQRWLNQPDLKAEWQKRRAHMLRERIDVARFMTEFITAYPIGKHPHPKAQAALPELYVDK